MLNLINIKKAYKIGDIETKALDGIDVAFRTREFVAILGASGSGKTTALNIIGGLDRYDSGEMTIKGKKTQDFKEKDWDAYRNNSIGFVFQNYNLIAHLSIVANVELSMTLSGVSYYERRKRAIKVLERVGLKDHLHKNPNQLSGGQMQRVAIARALVNDPEILLCDEPTGALDTVTSVQIMDIIKEISRDRLVIVVTHNPELAERYADRTIQFQDGKILTDSNPHVEVPRQDEFNLIKTSMSFLTALKLSFNNIRTKKGRTFLTAFASSIGIIGIAIILSLSTGMQVQIDKFQTDALAEFPIIVSRNPIQLDAESMRARNEQSGFQRGEIEYVDSDEVFVYDPAQETTVHRNIITDEYIEYVNDIDPAICSSIGYTRLVNMNLVRMTEDKAVLMQDIQMMSYPIQLDNEDATYLESHYSLLAGSYPKSQNDLVLVVDNKNRVNIETLSAIGFDTKNIDSIKFTDIVGTEFKLIGNDDFYTLTEFGNFIPGSDYQGMYDSQDSILLTITGIVRQSPDSKISILQPGLAYNDDLAKSVISFAVNSEIVKAQIDADYNVVTMKEMSADEKDSFISILGGTETPNMIMLYPKAFEEKEAVLAYLDEYNEGLPKDEVIAYTDLASTISGLTGGIMNTITLVLIAFAAISLVVSLIMIGIITYTSVLERTKEIGILKALGARKKDIIRVFDAETFILGVFSGLLGVSIAYAGTLLINVLILKATELENVATLLPLHALILIIISTILTMLGGHIPARMASRKDAVVALRTE